MINCRGAENRLKIIKEYNIKPIANLKLLEGDTIKSCAKDDITDHYYIFEYVSKNDKNKSGLLYCGEHVAKEFSKLTNKPLPKLYNILKYNSNNSIVRDTNLLAKGKITVAWNRERKQLYNAVMIFFIYWKIKPNKALYNIKTKLESYTGYPPYISHIKAVNTIIRNSGKTLDEIIKDIEDKGNKVKDFNFDLIIKRLEAEQIEQYFVNN